MGVLRPIEWTADCRVRFLDQTRLPAEEVWTVAEDYRLIADAIRRLAVRGAPLIGIAAAYGLALAACSTSEDDPARFRRKLKTAAAELESTRPTAVNLCWALRRLLHAVDGLTGIEEIRSALIEEARRIHEEDIGANRRIGSYGAALLPDRCNVLTHCNTGSLATGGYGTALGVVRAAWENGKLRHVYVTETRPLLQGARLTTWELSRDGIPFTLIVDSAAGSLMRHGLIDAVIVGADRIAGNADVANKIGTYALAVLARENSTPFYAAAPTSTIDRSLASGDDITIEERSAQEVSSIAGREIAAPGTAAANPAFDVTPNAYVTAIITENGAADQPYEESLTRLCRHEVTAGG